MSELNHVRNNQDYQHSTINYNNNSHQTSTISPQLYDSLLHTLEHHNSTSIPPSSLIYTQNNPSYTTTLNSHIRNLRFITPKTQKPLFILTPLHPSHIQGAVKWATKHGLEMKIRSGGHDYEGLSYVSKRPFFILDMFNLREIEIDLENETAWVEAGATLGELFFAIAKKSKVHGFPAGVCPTVGVGGHFSGAGYGNMMRKYGVTSDNIIDATFVDVKGRLLNRESMGEDLFWAIRGGGGSSFGVIVSFKIKLVKVPESVVVFRVPKTIEENAIEIVLQWQEIASLVDDDLFIRLYMEVVNKNKGEKTIRASFVALFLGDVERLVCLMNEKFPKLGLGRSHCHEMSWIESVAFWAEFPSGTPIEALLERRPSKLWHLTRKSDYVKEPISKEGWEFIFKRMIELETPMLIFNPYGGKMSEILEEEIPFPHRKGNLFKIQYVANWEEEGKEKEEYYIGLVRKLYDYMTPYVSKNPRQSYYNYRDIDLGVNNHDGATSYMEGRKYGVCYFKDNFDKLVRIKTLVDFDNFFRNEQSIPTLPKCSL